MENKEDIFNKITSISSDVEYLKGEYEQVKLWGSCPDGDVKFGQIANWLYENQYLVEHMIKVSNDLKELNK